MKRPSVFALVPLAFLFFLSIVSVRPVWARATLENPQPGSSQSGIGVISGWVCEAERVEIIFNENETDTWQAGYGTRRTDTQGICGDTNNGFGLLFNWNLLGDGSHTVRALADGVEFGSATVTVTTLGQEFLRGASSRLTVSDFPTAGTDIVLHWQQSQQNFVITAGSPGSGGGTSGSPPRVLENPQPGSFQSGIGVISGWVCEANLIEIEFDSDAANRWPAGYGTRRTDTQSVCGDTDNGFGLLFNWNLLGNGTHAVRVLADGVEFARTTVTVTTLGQEFLRGASGEATLPDFPQAGSDTVLRWQQSQQNFVIVTALPTQRLVDVSPDITIPAGVTSVQEEDISVTSLHSPTGQVRASPDSTLLLGTDAKGIVLLAIADKDGGFLGEEQNRVEVSLASTAATLVALAAGYSVPDITQDIVEQIMAHANYPALLAAMTTALAADKNFLERISDYPEVMRLIRSVATFRAGTTMQAAQMVSAQTTPVPPDGIRHDDFLCLTSEWLCSPWKEYEPWQWFGAINGVTSFLPPRPPPFLARSHTEPGLYATANPNFVDYALEVYHGDQYIDWFYVPGNASLVEKPLNSGAAYRELYTGLELDSTIDRVRFFRYRIDVGSQRAKILSFLNTFRVMTAGLGILIDVEIIEKWLDGLDPERQARNIAACATGVVNNWRDFYFDGEGSAVQQMFSLVEQGARAGFNALLSCHELLLPGMEEFIAKQATRVLGEYGKKVIPIVGQIYAAYDFVDETVNEAVPLGISYFSGPDHVDYHIQWEEDAQGNPYIARVSEDPPPQTPTNEAVTKPDIVSVSDASAMEGNTLTFTVQLSGSTTQPETYYYSTYFGGATAERGDYMGADGESFPVSSGRSSFTIPIDSKEDADDEDETFYLYVTGSSPPHPASTPGSSPSRGTGTIRENDEAGTKPDIASVSNASAMEGNTLTFTVQLSGSTTQPETYCYSTYFGDNATAEQDDYDGVGDQSVGVSSGRSSFRIRIGTKEDDDFDDETFYLYVTGSCNHPASTPGSSQYRGTGTIWDDDEAGTKPDIASVSNASAMEGNTLTFTVQLSGSTTQPETYYYSTYFGGATAERGDYMGADGESFPVSSGRSSFTIPIDSKEDADDEDETFYLYVTGSSPPHPASTPGSSPSRGTGTIRENDEAGTKPDIASVSNASAMEGNTLTFTVQLSGSTTQPETYCYSTYFGDNATAEQDDYDGVGDQSVGVSSGRSSFRIRIGTKEDDDFDDETFYLYVTGSCNHPASTPGSSQYRGTGTIWDDDEAGTKPDIASVSNASAMEGNTLTFTVQLSGSTTQPETYCYSTYFGDNATAEQDDYDGVGDQSVGVSSGRSSFRIRIGTKEDDDFDDETFYLYVTGSCNHPASTPGSSQYRGTGTIWDDDENSSALRVGARVEANPPSDWLNIRTGPGTSYTDIGDVRDGDRGTIVDGPMSSDGYTWWKVNWDSSSLPTGWIANVGGNALVKR